MGFPICWKDSLTRHLHQVLCHLSHTCKIVEKLQLVSSQMLRTGFATQGLHRVVRRTPTGCCVRSPGLVQTCSAQHFTRFPDLQTQYRGSTENFKFRSWESGLGSPTPTGAEITYHGWQREPGSSVTLTATVLRNRVGTALETANSARNGAVCL